MRHSEECRKRLHEAMREAGLEKIERADDEAPTRTQTRSKSCLKKQIKELPEETKILEAPEADHMELLDDPPDVPIADDHTDLNMADVPGSTNFFEEVDADPDLGLDWKWIGMVKTLPMRARTML